ncbi:MAG: transposase [Streptosporangiaceae bacterium]|nr:transposase [Streptosporangiaceae bacterium]
MFAKKPGLTRKAGPPVHEDLVDRVFTAPAPNVTWLTDITEHRTAEGKLYLCAIKDVYSGRIVGYSIDSRMKASLAVAALCNALARRDPVGTVVTPAGQVGAFRKVLPQQTVRVLVAAALPGPWQTPPPAARPARPASPPGAAPPAPRRSAC